MIKDFKDENYLNDEYVYNIGRKISNIIFNDYMRKMKWIISIGKTSPIYHTQCDEWSWLHDILELEKIIEIE